MKRTVFVLSDNSELSSGVSEINAIQNVTITQSVNSETDIAPGSVCASMVEATLITPGGGLSLSAGDEVTVYTEDSETLEREKVGIFVSEKPTRKSANGYKITAYDRVVKLDNDLTGWLNSLEEWPYALVTFAGMVCEQCGLTFSSTDFPNSDYQIPQFIGDGINGRRLMQWVGQIAARYVYANADGNICLGWYSANSKEITAVGSNYILQGSISYEDYTVPVIDKVQIQLTGDDIGITYPEDTAGENTYRITGNYILTAESSGQLSTVVQNIYNAVKDITYTPCKVSIPANPSIHAGDIITVHDANKNTITMYVMTKTTSGQRDTLECTGNHSRESTTAKHEESFGAVNAKMLEIRKDIEGLNVKATGIQTSLENGIKSIETQVAAIDLKADGISTIVSQQQEEAEAIKTRMTQIEQNADQIALSVQQIVDNGVSKVTTEFGLTVDGSCVDIHRSGTEMHNSLDETGMYVKRGDEVMLQANKDGVVATDVTIRNYLIVGSNARFEDYGTNRTACFYIGSTS